MMKFLVDGAAKLGLAVLFTLAFGAVERAQATTYYIGANGSDSNSGTSMAAPWAHAPGMPSCTATCASTVPQAGDRFIFRGGDTWHSANGNLSPYIGGTWNFHWNGSATNCDFDNGLQSTCIYIGVDPTWFSGPSWVRPAINMDNPIRSSLIPQGQHCAYDETNGPIGIVVQASYVTVDNFEFYGHCHEGIPNTMSGSYTLRNGNYITIENSYFHGWSELNNPQPDGQPGFDKAYFIGTASSSQRHNVIAHNVFDGSDSYCSAGGCSGQVVYIDSYIFEGNICRRVAGCQGAALVQCKTHDNLYEQMYESFDPASHGDIDFTYGNTGACPYIAFYNNTIRNNTIGQDISLDAPSGGTLYIFNNFFGAAGNSVNCLMFQNVDTANTAVYVTNNTFEAPCTAGNVSNNGNMTYFHGTIRYQNNHFIGYNCSPVSASCITYPGSNPYVTFSDDGGQVYQSVATANSQGYTSSNNYQPTSTSGATYHAGANLTSLCATFSSDSTLCFGTTGGVTNTAGSGNIPTYYVTLPPARESTWDSGAYQYALTGSGIQPPTGLTALVQ